MVEAVTKVHDMDRKTLEAYVKSLFVPTHEPTQIEFIGMNPQNRVHLLELKAMISFCDNALRCF